MSRQISPLPWADWLSGDAGAKSIDDMLHRGLGRRLSDWLNPAERERLGEPHCPVRLQPGEFGVLLCPVSATGPLQAGLVLPCRWLSPSDSDASSAAKRVPKGLRELADGSAVRLSAMQCVDRNDAHARQFVSGARLAVGECIGNLSDFKLSPESAGAALAVTLALAALKASPRLDCAVSATVHPNHGLGLVSGLADKVDAARRANITEVFVANAQGDRPEGCTVIDGHSASAQFSSLMLKFDAPPEDGTKEEKWRWYKRVSGASDPASKHAANVFYVKNLVESAAASARASASGLTSVDELVLMATGSQEPSLASIALHRPKRLIVLTIDGNSKKFADGLRELCKLLDPQLVPAEMGQRSLEEWIQSDEPAPKGRRCMVDLTGGTTAAKVRVLDHSRKRSMSVSCLDSAEGFDRLKFQPL